MEKRFTKFAHMEFFMETKDVMGIRKTRQMHDHIFYLSDAISQTRGLWM